MVSKKVGQSTVRNKVRRRIKAIAHSFWNVIHPTVDLVVIAKIGCAEADFSALKEDFLGLARKGRLIHHEKTNPLDN